MSDVVAPAAEPVVAPAAVEFTDAAPALEAAPAAAPAAPAAAVDPPKVEEPKADPAAAAVRAAAKASYEARQAKGQLAKIQAELDEAKSQGAKTAELQASLDAIKKNPRKLLDLGLDIDGILHDLLEQPEELDPRLAATQAEIKALKDRLDSEADAKKKSEEAQLAAQTAELQRRADAEIAKNIVEWADKYPFVAADDVATIRDGIYEFCQTENYSPTDAEAREMVEDACKQIHEQRLAKYKPAIERLAKVAAPAGAAPQPNAITRMGVGFTDDPPAAPPSPAKRTPAPSPASITPGLPVPRRYTPVGFTD